MAVSLYYYTSVKHLKSIYEQGLIWTTSGAAGDGVYLTEMPPMIGRLTIAEHLYEDPQDTYAMTEVCLKTVSVAVPAEKVPGQPEENLWMVWMAKTHLDLSSFSVLYCAVSDTDWTKTEVKSFIKKQHLSVNRNSESPTSQLQEMAVQSGMEPLYRKTSKCTYFVSEVCVPSLSAVGVGYTKRMAKFEAAKQLMCKLISGISENTSEMRPDDKNIISVTVETDANETALANAVGNMLITEKKQDVSRSTGEVLTSNEALLNYTSTSERPLKSSSDNSSSASDRINPVVTLRALCMYNNLPLPIYKKLPPLENEDQNTITMVVKVGEVVATGISWTKSMAEKTAASIMLQKLSKLNREDILGNEELRPNKPLLTADAFKEQGDCFRSDVPSNPVESLQEFCATRGWTFPIYYDAGVHGPPHARAFVVHCCFFNLNVSGMGVTKKDAMGVAALKMWRALTSN